MAGAEEFLNAVKTGDAAGVERMLAEAPELAGVRGPGSETVLALALYHGRRGVIDALLSRGYELSVFEAAALGRRDRVAQCIEDSPGLATEFSPDGFTALHLAAFFGHPEMVEYLLEAGAGANVYSRNAIGVAPLHSALAYRDRETAERMAAALVRHGADVNAPQGGGVTPLHEAAHNGYPGAARLLLEHGADVNPRTDDGQTPLAMAAAAAHTEVADLLRRHGAE